MRVVFCPNCMREVTGSECPNCGFKLDGRQRTADVLPKKTLLNGRYMICGVSGLSQTDITYGLFDTKTQGKAEAKEYFPREIVERGEDNRLIWPAGYTPDQVEAACEAYLSGPRKLKDVPLPGAAAILEAYADNGSAYVISEYPEGETLKSRIQNNGPMPPEECRRIFLNLCGTLESLHALGLLHGSIDPRRILLLSGGGTCLLAPGGGDGDRAFHPPEEVNREDAGTWSDVYSLCASAYYCLTGNAPADIYARSQGGELVWSENIPGDMRSTLERGLCLAFRNRTQTARQLAGDLDAGRTASLRPESGDHTMLLNPDEISLRYFDSTTDPFEEIKKQKKQKKKKRIIVTSAALALFVAAVFLGLSLAKLIQPRQDPDGQETSAGSAETEGDKAEENIGDGDGSDGGETGESPDDSGTEDPETASPTGSEAVKDEPIALNYEEYELEKGDTLSLEVLDGRAVTWSSSGPKTASVDERGVVTASTVGTAIITATDEDGGQASCAITVPGVVSIELDTTSLFLTVGQSHTFTPKLIQFGSREARPQLASSDPRVVSVNEMTVTAVGEGRATLMFFTSGGVSCTCEVTVRSADGPQPQGGQG